MPRAAAPTGPIYEATDGATPGGGRAELVSVFADPHALTFPIVVALVKAAWAGSQGLPVAWVSTVWLPFAACVGLGMVITVSNLRESARSVEDWSLGLAVGFLNCLLLFAAVLGVSPAGGAAGPPR